MASTCPSGQYWDSILGDCRACGPLCDPDEGGSPDYRDCQGSCPGFVLSTTTTGVPTTSAQDGNTNDGTEGVNILVPLFVGILAFLIVVAAVIFLILWRMKRWVWDKTPTPLIGTPVAGSSGNEGVTVAATEESQNLMRDSEPFTRQAFCPSAGVRSLV